MFKYSYALIQTMIHCSNLLAFVVKDKKVQNVYQAMTTSQALSNNFK